MLLEPRSRERFSTEQGKRGKFDAKQDSRRGRKPAAPGPLRRFGYLDKAREPGVGETLIMSAVLPSPGARSSTPFRPLLFVAVPRRRRALRQRLRRPPTPLEDSPGEALGRV
jgi:hypothetical protein